MNDEKKKVFWVGTFVVASLMLLSIILIWKSQFWLQITGLKLFVQFENANGLVRGSDVRYRGYTVGRVSKINPMADKIIVQVIIKKQVGIPKTTRAKILFDGIVGENYITLSPYEKSKILLRSGDIIEGQASYGVANFVDIAAENLQELKDILSSLSQTFGDEEVVSSIKKTFSNLGALSAQLESVVRELKEISLAEDVGVMIKSLRNITTRLEKSIDEEFVDNTGQTMENLSYITQELRDLLEQSDFKENITAAVNRGSKLIKRSDSLLEKITNIRLKTTLIGDFSTESSDYNYRVNANFWYGDQFLRLGLGNRFKKDKVLSIQQSIPLFEGLRSRIGFFYEKFGVGFDYTINPFLLEVDFYNFDQTRADIALSFPIYKRYIWLRGGVAYLDDVESSAFAGISLFP